MPTNKEFTDQAIALGAELGKEVTVEGLNNAELAKIVKELKEAKAIADAEAKAIADAEAKAIADAEAKAIADAEAKAIADAEAKAVADAEAKALADAEAKDAVEVVLDCTYGKATAGDTVKMPKEEAAKAVKSGWVHFPKKG